MTVGELIEKLSKYDSDKEVLVRLYNYQINEYDEYDITCLSSENPIIICDY